MWDARRPSRCVWCGGGRACPGGRGAESRRRLSASYDSGSRPSGRPEPPAEATTPAPPSIPEGRCYAAVTGGDAPGPSILGVPTMRWTPLVAAVLAALACALLPAAPAAAAADATPPVTTCDAPAGWQRASFVVHFSATDAESGVAAIWAAIDDGQPAQVGGPAGGSLEIPAPADHSFDGVHTLRYYSVDVAGNTETARVAQLRVDTDGAGRDRPGGGRLRRARRDPELPRARPAQPDGARAEPRRHRRRGGDRGDRGAGLGEHGGVAARPLDSRRRGRLPLRDRRAGPGRQRGRLRPGHRRREGTDHASPSGARSAGGRSPSPASAAPAGDCWSSAASTATSPGRRSRVSW